MDAKTLLMLEQLRSQMIRNIILRMKEETNEEKFNYIQLLVLETPDRILELTLRNLSMSPRAITEDILKQLESEEEVE